MRLPWIATPHPPNPTHILSSWQRTPYEHSRAYNTYYSVVNATINIMGDHRVNR